MREMLMLNSFSKVSLKDIEGFKEEWGGILFDDAYQAKQSNVLLVSLWDKLKASLDN